MVEIRAAVEADGRAIAEVQRKTWQATYSRWIPDVVAAFDVDESAENWARGAVRDDRRVAVAVDGARLIGFCGSGPAIEDEQLDPARVGQVYALYVDPDHHGSGAGRRLVDDAFAWMRSTGRTECVLWVAEPSERSRGFYEHIGFRLDEGARQDWRGLPIVRYRRLIEDTSPPR